MGDMKTTKNSYNYILIQKQTSAMHVGRSLPHCFNMQASFTFARKIIRPNTWNMQRDPITGPSIYITKPSRYPQKEVKI